jgi:hypothetical protein
LGRWSKVLSLRRRREKAALNERILGSGEFIEQVLSEEEERVKETLRWRGRVPDLQTLLSRISRREGVEEQKIRGGDRRRPVVRMRKVFCQVAVKKLGYSGGGGCAVFGGNHLADQSVCKFWRSG